MSNLVIPDGGNIGSASDTDAISISSTGKVTTADSELNVKTTSHTFTVKGIDEVIYEDDGTTVVDADSGQFAVYNGSTKLFGITEHGYVLKPDQPAFTMSMSAVNTGGVGVVVFDRTILNNGGHYSTSNGRFTAPVAGIYYFGLNVLKNTGTVGNADIRIRKNGGNAPYDVSGFNGDGRSGYSQSSAQAVYHLNAGDYVDAYKWDSSPWYSGTSESHTHFTGHLIG